MAESERTPLPYDMGNAGDLLKHGVLAEFLRACLVFRPTLCIRLIDLFGGEPFRSDLRREIIERIDELSSCALHGAQPDIGTGRYLGSGMLARKLGDSFGGRVSVVASDRDPGRRERLREAGLTMLEDEFPSLRDEIEYDAYSALEVILRESTDGDVILIDPYAEFLPRAESVLPILGNTARGSPVLMFALNRDPFNRVGRRFDELLQAHLGGAIIMTCPPIRRSEIRGEGKFHADVVLSAPGIFEQDAEFAYIRQRLERLADRLADVLGLSERGRAMLRPRLIGRTG